jgi:hypothetical protein
MMLFIATHLLYRRIKYLFDASTATSCSHSLEKRRRSYEKPSEILSDDESNQSSLWDS